MFKKVKFSSVFFALLFLIFVFSSLIISYESLKKVDTTQSSAQQSCNYKAISSIKLENGNLIDDASVTVHFKIVKGSQIVREGNTNLPGGKFSVDAPMDSDLLVKNAGCSGGGCTAQVWLNDGYTNRYIIVSKYCSNNGQGGCPNTSGTDSLFSNFNYVCNAAYDYGWILRPVTSACSYYAKSSVKNESGNLINGNDYSARFSIRKGDTLIRSGVVSLTNGNFVVDYPSMSDGDPQTSPCVSGGCTAEVALLKNGVAASSINAKYCSNSGPGGCPDSSGTDGLFSNFNYICNAKYDYGWVIKTVTPTPSLVPSSTPIPSSTPSSTPINTPTSLPTIFNSPTPSFTPTPLPTSGSNKPPGRGQLCIGTIDEKGNQIFGATVRNESSCQATNTTLSPGTKVNSVVGPYNYQSCQSISGLDNGNRDVIEFNGGRGLVWSGFLTTCPNSTSPTVPPSTPTQTSGGSSCQFGTDLCSVDNLSKHFSDRQKATYASMICRLESNSNLYAYNKRCLSGEMPDYSIGLFQINLLAHCPGAFSYTINPPSCSIIDQTKLQQCEEQYYNADNNIQKAVQLSSGGTNWSPWKAAQNICSIP